MNYKITDLQLSGPEVRLFSDHPGSLNAVNPVIISELYDALNRVEVEDGGRAGGFTMKPAAGARWIHRPVARCHGACRHAETTEA